MSAKGDLIIIKKVLGSKTISYFCYTKKSVGFNVKFTVIFSQVSMIIFGIFSILLLVWI